MPTPRHRIALAFLLLATAAAACGDDDRDSDDDAVAAPVLVRTDPAGAACAHGGTLVKSGPDRDGDGVLDDDEVAVTTPVCAAPTEPTEPALLTRLDAVPAGATCPAGGVAFVTGRDRNGNGVLEPAESEHTDTRCGDTVDGDLAIRSDADVTALAAITSITGSLTIAPGATVTALRLPALRFIGKRLELTNASTLISIDLPGLLAVGQVSFAEGADIYVGRNGALTSLRLGMVACGWHHVSIEVNPSLTAADITCPAVRSLYVFHNRALATLRLDVGYEGGSLTIDEHPALAELAVRAGSLLELDVQDAPVLTALTVTPFQSGSTVHVRALSLQAPVTAIAPTLQVHGSLWLNSTRITELAVGPVESLTLQYNEVLAAVDAEAAHDISASGNPVLTTLEVRDRRRADGSAVDRGTVSLTSNPMLESAPWLSDLGQVESFTVEGNPRLHAPEALDLVVTSGALRLDGVTGIRSLSARLIGYRYASIAATSLESLVVAASGDSPRATSLWVTDNPSLARATLSPGLSGTGAAQISGNGRLTDLALTLPPLLRSASIVDNAHLPACLARRILDTTEAVTEAEHGNDERATCP